MLPEWSSGGCRSRARRREGRASSRRGRNLTRRRSGLCRDGGRRGRVDAPHGRLGQVRRRQASCVDSIRAWRWARGFLFLELGLLVCVLLLLDHLFGQWGTQSTGSGRVCRSAGIARSGGESTRRGRGCCLAMVVDVFWRRRERGSCVVGQQAVADDASLLGYSRSLRDVRGCDTWFSRASMRSRSDLLVLPGILSLMRLGILSLILDRQPLPPPEELLLLLSLPPPGCHPPFAMFRSPDMVLRNVMYTLASLCFPPLNFVCRYPMPRLRQPS